METPVQDSRETDVRLRPTPDYGSLGPTPDFKGLNSQTSLAKADAPKATPNPQLARWHSLAAMGVGVLGAFAFMAAGNVNAAWHHLALYLNLHRKSDPVSPANLSEHDVEKLHQQSPQKQAEFLLERAINHYDGANEQIAERVEQWRLKRIKLTPQLNSLIIAAFNSDNLHVRESAVEIDLAAMNVAKVPSNVDHYSNEAESKVQSERVWALWILGLLGNRGIEPERVKQVLTAHLHDADQESRHWAVEGLALVASDDTIPPLMQAFHDDPSPMVRERAACSLAQSGMFSDSQRLSMIPQLLDFAEDPSLDAHTHAWAFHALRDITAQNLPDEAAAWRNWYGAQGGN
jgi:hypothetical protein